MERDGVVWWLGAVCTFAAGPIGAGGFAALDGVEAAIADALARDDFTGAVTALSALRGPIDAFFEEVQVNTENQTQRRNRLNLLNTIRTICLQVADLTRIDG